MQITGGCHCGALRYSAEFEPERVSICHCTDCQILSGTAYRVVAQVDAAQFALECGEPRTYVRTADNGNRRAQVFCGDCGSHIYATSADTEPEWLGVRVGTVDQRAQLKPARQVWCQSALDWTRDLSGLPGTARQ